jgi:AraC family transcriptional regulator
MSEIPTGGKSAAFGVSVMVNDNDFDYWATIEAAPDTAVPAGMDTIGISASLYVRTTTSMDKLGEAFMYVYTQWVHEQSEYTLDMQGACFELYPPNWQPSGAVEVYSPVVKR